MSPFLVATSFAAGLNAYAMVATLGLLARFGLITLPPKLGVLTNGYVIGACTAVFLIEFVADKIPLFDLLWNAVHTFVRPPIAALVAYGSTTELSPQMRLLSVVVGGIIALAAHSAKTAVRTMISVSPEPLSNVTLSAAEDALAIFLTWVATAHPYWAATIVMVSLVAVAIALRYVVRAATDLVRGAEEALEEWLS